jgi:hypothetical protein
MIVSHLIEVVIVITFWILMKRENVRRDKLQAEMLAGMGPEERERELARTAYGDLTDRENLNFRCESSLLLHTLPDDPMCRHLLSSEQKLKVSFDTFVGYASIPIGSAT